MNPSVSGVPTDRYAHADPFLDRLKAQYYEKMEETRTVVTREKRKSPYTTKEKKFLAMLVSRYVDIIDSKKTNKDTNVKKLKAWARITAEFNAGSLESQQSTLQQLKKLWLNMKSRMKAQMNSGVGNGDGDPSTSDVSMDNNQEESITFPIEMVQNLPSDDGEETTELIQCNIKEEEHTTQPEFIDTSEGYYKIQLTQNPAKRKLDSPNTSADVQQDLGSATTTKRKSNPTIGNSTESQNYLEQLQITQLQNEIVQREIMFNHNMEHAKQMDDLNYRILQLEYEHKRKYYTMIEEEQELRISRLKNAINMCSTNS